ncbi:MAG: (Fe-S)-binding protein [Bifidobacteriaceae bacterium]|jgi:Fe-S oxidoreductase|nr:(Fe-S)-binding protein [Bifidobacteriaceae bacterium]
MNWFGLVGLTVTAVGWTCLALRVGGFVHLFRAGPAELPGSRRGQPWRRTAAMLHEFLAHRRLSRKPLVAVAHWLTMMSFLVLVATLAQATGQLFNPRFELPWLGHWLIYNWLTELLAWAGLGGIVVLVAVRLWAGRARLGPASRFFGSHQWRARYVEATILAVVILVLWLRGIESVLAGPAGWARFATTAWIGRLYPPDLSDAVLAAWVSTLALAKILVSYAWMVVVSLTPTMGVAWHRFLAFPNLWTGRDPNGRPALGGLEALVVDGRVVDLEDPALDESVLERLGAGWTADLTWRDRLALATCTECGRCQEVCPVWQCVTATLSGPAASDTAVPPATAAVATSAAAPGGPAASDTAAPLATAAPASTTLSPKLLVSALRDHVFGSEPEPSPLVGGDSKWAITPEVLWACTTCGACTAACPVGVEHVDQIIELRRHQVLVAADFPAGLGTTFRNLERRSNPWGMLPRQRLDWAKGLSFEPPVLGQTIESLDQVDYLFWVGCAGAFDERGQTTARALAELLHQSGVSFAVLGEQAACCGDPARRTGNEALFAALASANADYLNQAGAKRIIVTCAHCRNTLANEYSQFGGHYQVIHHTELLADLINQGRLVPRNLGDGIVQVTYQDPCYLARHNRQSAAPRRLLGSIPGLRLTEMAQSGDRTNCCGGGGGRMWWEDSGPRLGQRRFEQAAMTGADMLATACPFCHIMLADAAATAGSDLPVRDLAELVLAAVSPSGQMAEV